MCEMVSVMKYWADTKEVTLKAPGGDPRAAISTAIIDLIGDNAKTLKNQGFLDNPEPVFVVTTPLDNSVLVTVVSRGGK